MADHAERRRRERAAFLAALYERTQANVAEFVDGFALADELGIERAELRRYLEYLGEKGWVVVDDYQTGVLRITAAGVDRVETQGG